MPCYNSIAKYNFYTKGEVNQMQIKKLLAVALAAAMTLSTLSTTTLTQPKKASAATFTNLNQKQLVVMMPTQRIS